MSTKWRGAQSAPNVTVENINALMATDANIVRYQFDPNYWDESLVILDYVIAAAKARNKRVVLNISRPLAGTNPVTDLAARSTFKSMWSSLAIRYDQEETVLAFGILNEPSGSGQQVNQFMLEVHQVIRSISPKKRIAVTCPHSDPSIFYKTKFIRGDENVWYEVHMYLPMKLTHQGISGNLYPKSYPTALWNKPFLIDKLDHVRRFQNENKARIYVGEFSISNFASDSSRVNYLRDCISIFERYGWNWTYHAWREASVWDVEPYPRVYQVLQTGWRENVI